MHGGEFRRIRQAIWALVRLRRIVAARRDRRARGTIIDRRKDVEAVARWNSYVIGSNGDMDSQKIATCSHEYMPCEGDVLRRMADHAAAACDNNA